MSDSLKEKTAKGLLWGGIGNGVMQIASFVFGIFLSRMLSPSDYGMVGILTIFSAIAGMFVEAGFITAIVNKREVTHRDYNAVFWFSFLMGVGLYLLMFLCAPVIAHFYNIPELVPLSRYLFIGTIFSCLGTSTTAYYTRNLKVKERSIIQIVAITASGITGVTLAYLGFGYWGIATQTITYIAFSTIGMWIICPWKPTLDIDFSPLREMFSYSSKLLLTTLFTHINNNIFSVLLGRFSTIQQVGYYTQGNKWTIMGYSTIVGMLSSVTQPVLREARDNHTALLNVFRKMLRFTVFISFPVMLGLGAVAQEVIVIIITDKWLPAATVMSVLCFGGAFTPIVTLFSGLMNSIGRPQIYLYNTVTLGILQICCLLLTLRFGLNVMLTIYVTINILWLGVWTYFARRYIGFRFLHLFLDIMPYFLIAVFSIAVACYAASFVENIYLSLCIKIAVAVLLYLLIMWLSGSVMFRETYNFIIKRRIGQ